MKTITLEVPAMYGDHHVTEVRRLLLDNPGVVDIYVSSAFHLVEVRYDEAKINEEQIQTILGDAGYLEPLPMPAESSEASHLKRISLRPTFGIPKASKPCEIQLDLLKMSVIPVDPYGIALDLV